MSLTQLVALRGELPLRGWKRCEETGLALPPRAHYCRTSKAMIKRMDHFCMFTNACVGHANQHYFMCFLAFLSASTLYVLCATSYALAATKPATLFTDALLRPRGQRDFNVFKPEILIHPIRQFNQSHPADTALIKDKVLA